MTELTGFADELEVEWERMDNFSVSSATRWMVDSEVQV